MQEAVLFGATLSITPATRFDPNAANDIDGDFVSNGEDNCPELSNPDQLNSDSAPIQTEGIGPSDHTIANADFQGDACDDDDDNDRIDDFWESILPSPSFLGCDAVSGALDSNRLDSDGDRVADLAECLLGSDPASQSSTPVVPEGDSDGDRLADAFEVEFGFLGFDPNDTDSDDDGIGDGVEFKGYNTSPIVVDTDGDDCPDGLEISSVDLNTVVNSNDLLIVAFSFASATRPNMDIDKNGTVNSNDLLIVALNYNLQCGLPD